MSVVILLALGGLTVANYRTCPDVRYPPFIMSTLWLLAMTIYYVAPMEINGIGILTALIFIATILAFSGGGQLALAFHNSNSDIQATGSTPVAWAAAHSRLKKIFLTLSAATLPLVIEKAFQMVSQSGSEIFFIGLRTELLAADSGGYGLLGYIAVLSFFTTFLYAIEPRSGIGEKLQSYLSLAISLVYAVLSTGRSTIVFILVVLMGIAFMRRKSNFTRVVLTAFVFFLFFGFFAIATLKGGDPDATWAENISSIGESLLVYEIGPLPAFDQVARADLPLEYGKNTLIGPLNLLRGLAGMTRVSRLREEVHVPFPTNVYTGINAAYRDFGVPGVVLVFFLVGGASTYFYLRGLAGDPLYIFCYAVSLYPLLLVTFSDEYFDPMNAWIMYGVAAYLYFRRVRAVNTTEWSGISPFARSLANR